MNRLLRCVLNYKSVKLECLFACAVLGMAFMLALISKQLNIFMGSGSPHTGVVYALSLWLFVLVNILVVVLFVVQLCKTFASIYKKDVLYILGRVTYLFFSFVLCYFIFHYPYIRSPDLLDGFSQRLEEHMNAEDIRQWAVSYIHHDNHALEYRQESGIEEIGVSIPLPDVLERLNPSYANIYTSESGGYVVRLYHGGGSIFPRWGVDITDPKQPFGCCMLLSNMAQYRYQLKPGVYVWHQLSY